MKEFEIIADSGGTKTDWIVCDGSMVVRKFTTGSYHPRMINKEFIDRQKEFWKKNPALSHYQLTFYGSGCFQKDKAQFMKAALEEMGFCAPKVYSDIEAAASALDLKNGWGAICGTGSVVFKVENSAVTEIRGGLGRENGDEGSGYYFGKLLAKSVIDEAVLLPELSKDELSQPDSYPTFAHRFYSHRSNEAIGRLHEESIQTLVDKCLIGVKEISFVGGYAFHYQSFFKNVLLKNGIRAIDFIEKPIEKLM